MRALIPRAASAAPTPPPPDPDPPPSNDVFYYWDPDNVSGTASDSNSGTAANAAWLSHTKVLRDTPAGARVYTRDCEFESATWSNLGGLRDGFLPITVEPYPGDELLMPNTSTITLSNVRNVTFKGFTKSAAAPRAGAFVSINGSHHLSFENSVLRACNINAGGANGNPPHHITIANNTIERDDGSEVAFLCNISSSAFPAIDSVTIRGNMFRQGQVAVRLGRVTNCIVEYNDIADIIQVSGGEHSDGIRTIAAVGETAADGLVIRGNWLHDNDTSHLFFKDGTVKNLTLVDNLVSDRIGSGTAFTGYRIEGGVIMHNTFESGGIVWALQGVASSNIVVANNILGSHGADTGAAPSFLYRDYNIITGSSAFAAETNGSTVAPTYVDANGDNFDLADGSSGRNAGVASISGVTMPLLDRLQRTRPFGAAPDIGAHERQS